MGAIQAKKQVGVGESKLYNVIAGLAYPFSKPGPSENDYEFFMTQTHMSRDEIRTIFENFNEKNSNGKLNRDEFVQLYMSLRPEPPELLTKISEQIFRCFDLNNNNFIEFNEFMIGFAITSRGDLRKKLSYAFSLYDHDNNGYLDENEITEIMKSMGILLGIDQTPGAIEQFVDDCMTTLDISKDGVISKGKLLSLFR